MMKKLLNTIVCLLLCISGTTLSAQTIAKDCPLVAKTQVVEGGTIHYLEGGNGPAVLLLHGLFAQKEQWIEVGCALAKQSLRVIAPDLPGYGASRPFPNSVYHLHQQVEVLQSLMDKLQIKVVHLGGSSMGGAIAALYAKRHPSQVQTLAFIGAPLGIAPWSPQIQQSLGKGINLFIPQNSAEFDLEMQLLFAKPPLIDPTIKETLIQSYRSDRSHYQMVWEIVNQYTRILEPMRLTQPTFAVWGAQDGVFLAKGANALQQRITNGKVKIDPNSAHLLMLEDPQRVSQDYERFIKQSGRAKNL
jgi:pimeloyl-ACP methyl ester carboxylesterase